MTLCLNDFRGEILGRTAESICHGTISRLLYLRQAEVCDLEMTLGVKNDVLGLQIPIDDAVLVQVLESQHDLSRVKARTLLLESCLLAQMEE